MPSTDITLSVPNAALAKVADSVRHLTAPTDGSDDTRNDATVVTDWIKLIGKAQIDAAQIQAAKDAVDAATTDADRKDALLALYNLQHA